METPTRRRIITDEYDGLYNAERFNEAEIRDLLADNSKKLFINKELIYESRYSNNFRIKIAGQFFFVKEIRGVKSRGRICGVCKSPICWRYYWNIEKLLKEDLPAPAPIFAVTFNVCDVKKQILVTDYCCNAVPFSDYIAEHSGPIRRDLITDLVDLITDFHIKGFYSPELSPQHILVDCVDAKRKYNFVNVDSLTSFRFFPRRVFTATVSRSCADFYEILTPSEKNFLLVCYFDLALKKNIFSKPSQQQKFIKSAVNHIKKLSEESCP